MTTREIFETLNREDGIKFFNAKKTDKEIYDILVSKGLTDDFETFKAEGQKLFTEKVSSMSKEEILAQIEGVELTDEQLEQIAGGGKTTEFDNPGGALGTIAAGSALGAVIIAAAVWWAAV